MGRGKKSEPEIVEGTVTKITFKPTKGDNEVCNICLDTGGRDDEWFGFGFEEPEFEEGAVIEFEVEYNGKFTNVVTGSVEVLEEAPKKRKGSSRGGSSGGRGSSSRGSSRDKSSGGGRGGKSSGRDKAPAKAEVDWDRKDNLIRLQSSQNTAVATLNVLLTHGLIALPKKKAQQMDAVVALIEEEAARLFDKYTDIVDDNYEGYAGGGKDESDDDDDVPD